MEKREHERVEERERERVEERERERVEERERELRTLVDVDLEGARRLHHLCPTRKEGGKASSKPHTHINTDTPTHTHQHT